MLRCDPNSIEMIKIKKMSNVEMRPLISLTVKGNFYTLEDSSSHNA